MQYRDGLPQRRRNNFPDSTEQNFLMLLFLPALFIHFFNLLFLISHILNHKKMVQLKVI